jgi:hypothetical protein
MLSASATGDQAVGSTLLKGGGLHEYTIRARLEARGRRDDEGSKARRGSRVY